MKLTYISTQTRIAFLSRSKENKKDIHAQLQQTIAERKQIINNLQNRAKAMVLALEYVKAA